MPGQILKLGDVVPNFTTDTTQGYIDFHRWVGDGWAILFSHPADYTPVCTTELGRVQKLHGSTDNYFLEFGILNQVSQGSFPNEE
jgi:alkyl hydroperoxide reductase subunit AhpC